MRQNGLVIPTAIPIVKIKAMLAKARPPAPLNSAETTGRIQEISILPIPRSNPETGRMAIGSNKAVLNISEQTD